MKKGFGLMEVMIAGALLAGLGVAGMKLMKSQQNASKAIEQSFEINQTISEISVYISNPYSCQKSFEDVEPVDFVEEPNTTNNVTIKNKDGSRTILKKDDEISKKLKVVNIYARKTENDPIEDGAQGIFELVVEFEKKRSENKTSRINRVFKIVGSLDDDGKVINCSASDLGLVLAARVQICTDLGYTFDEERNPPCYKEGDGILPGGYP